MPLYKNTSAQLVSIKEKPFKLEREIQKIFENNLFTIMGIELVKPNLQSRTSVSIV